MPKGPERRLFYKERGLFVAFLALFDVAFLALLILLLSAQRTTTGHT